MSKFIVVFVVSLSGVLSACTGFNSNDLMHINSITSLNNHVSIKRQRHFVIAPASTVALQVTLSPIANTTNDFLGSRQLILNGLKQHFQRVELFDHKDLISDDFDFVVMVNLLNLATRSGKIIDKERQVVAVQEPHTLVTPNMTPMMGVVEKEGAFVNNRSNTLASDGGRRAMPLEVVDYTKEYTQQKGITKAISKLRVSLAEGAMTPYVPATNRSITPLQARVRLNLIDARSNRLIDVVFIDAYSSAIRKPSYDDFIRDIINRYGNTITGM
jgi:hypothetical protein